MEKEKCGSKGESARKYVDILTDAGFKAVFGDRRNKEVLIDFLNVVLPAHRKVRDLEYSTTEIPSFTLETKSVRLDLRCEGDDGTRFIVEMQQSGQRHFFKRCVEYAAKVYDSGSRRGGDYDIEPVYFIGILGRERIFGRCGPEWKDRYISEYTFREKHTGEVPDESISLCGAGPLREAAGRMCRTEGEPPAFQIIRQAQRFVSTIRFRIYYVMTVPIRAMGPLLYVE